jgi:hypothetical protein
MKVSVKIEEDVKTDLTKFAGELQAKTGETVTISDAIQEAVKKARMVESFKMHYASKVQTLQSLLGQFPPYHGESFNYTKQEVEAWLEKAKLILQKEP